MFVHIGNGNVIRSEEIVAIVDVGLVPSSVIMDEMMAASRKKANVIGPKKEAKSIMITKETIYYSTLSVATLKKRSSINSTISKTDDFTDEILS